MSDPKKTVAIYGMAPNLGLTPPPLPGVEVWLSNWHKGYRQRLPRALTEWTRYFNLHSRKHMDTTYPNGVEWYQQQDGTRPIYTQKLQPDFPGCIPFPIEQVLAYAGHKYFTFSGSLLMAFAVVEGFERVEMWGFELKDKPSSRHAFERPCFFYWVQRLRAEGIEVTYQPEIDVLPFEPGNPLTYTGPLYGFQTKPED